MTRSGKAFSGGSSPLRKGKIAGLASLAVIAAILAPATAAPAQAATVGQGFTITPSDLSYILKQIKVAEAHVANTTSATGPCGALIGTGPNQLPSPLLSFGLRTVDGSCNNLVPGKARIGAADEVFPRLTTPVFRPAGPAAFGPPGPTSYDQTSGNVFDTEPRVISNLIVDQTSTNPAAVEAAGFPVRTQGNEGVVPCVVEPGDVDPVTGNVDANGRPDDCVPAHETLFIPNVTTDVGLSPPYNSLFTLFGQFFDHGVDQTVKGGSGTVFVPLKDDDPLIAGPNHIFGDSDDLDPNLRFMVLTRGTNQPGADHILGTGDDIRDTKNTDSPWVDQSQTYTSHPSHQAFLREYEMVGGKPVATGKLLGGEPVADDPATPVDESETDPGMATWATTKKQAAEKLGLLLDDNDVLDIPMLVADAYGNFVPGPNGLPQYMTTGNPVEGDLANPVPVPANALHFDTPFLTDIAHSATPTAVGPDSDNVAGEQLDTTVPAGSYDDELLDAHFTAGDGRVNENIGLTAIHQIFHSEHDRLVDDIQTTLDDPANAALRASYRAVGATTFDYGERLFQAARFVTEMEYQHLVFEEFARKVQPAINPFEPFAFTQPDLNPAIRAEFAHAVYRFGHSMLTETIARKNGDGSTNDISLLDGFLNPPSYTAGGPAGTLNAQQAAGSIIMGMSDQTGNELDEFVTDTLRNNLLGLPLDLPTINMTRARSEGIPPLNVVRRQIFNATNDGQLQPYTSWVDFGENLKHPASLVNFVAAYGQHPTILTDPGGSGPDGIAGNADDGQPTLASRRAAATKIVNPVLGDVDVPADAVDFMNSAGDWANAGNRSITGLDDVDLWVGGLAEITSPFGGLLGTTFNYVFENQLTDLQNGDRLYYLARTPGMNLRTQLEGNSFAELIMRNTEGTNTLKADPFATADCKFQLGHLAGTPAGFAQFGNTVADDPTTECIESAVLIRLADGTIQYRQFNSEDPSGINAQAVYNGTDGIDKVRGGNDNDTFWGGLGNDVIEGGSGADVALGGEDDDIITDLAGDDVPKGGPGNDAIDAGPGLDILMGGQGKDFTNGGANANETFAGDGDDFVYLGQSLDAAFGDSGDDWEEGGDQPDLMQGDSGNLFFTDDSQKPGHDILVGQGGDDDYDMEGGDDIGLGGTGIEKVAGASGYDWEIGQGEPQAQDMDLDLPIPGLDILQAGVRDKFNEVEALSGWKFDDTLRGDDLVLTAVGGAGFLGCDVLDQAGLDRIAGLDALVPPLNTPLATVVNQSASQDCPTLTGPNVWGDGNILLGGGGSDLMEGRGADDIIDGDAYVSVRLSVRTDPNNPLTEIGSAGVEGPGQSAMTSQYLHTSTGALTGPTLQQAVFARTVNPRQIVAVREIKQATGGTDTALFSGAQAEYTVTPVTNGVQVAHVGGAATDGVDTITNIENLRFCEVRDANTDVCTQFSNLSLEAPSAPTDVTATALNASALVTWSEPAGTTGITSFTVQAFAGTNQVASTTVAGTASSALVTGLTNGVPVTFKVTANGAIGSATSSASAPVTPQAPANTAPGAPTIGAATAGVGSGSVTWTPPASNGGAAITSYTVEAVNATTNALIRSVSVTAPATSNLVTGLPANTSVKFRVAAVNSVGQGAFSAFSNSVTVTAETTAPVISARSPLAGATNVPLGTAVTVTFSEPVQGVTNTTFTLRVGAAAPVAATVTMNAANTVATLTPSAPLANLTTYTATLTGGAAAIRDLAGNPLVTSAATFRTVADVIVPTVVSRAPAPGATGVAVGRNVVVVFSERVTVPANAFQLVNQAGNRVNANVTLSADGRTATLNPNANLAVGRQFRVNLTNAIRDAAGNRLTALTWTFRT
jgi:hypothetical protein